MVHLIVDFGLVFFLTFKIQKRENSDYGSGPSK